MLERARRIHHTDRNRYIVTVLWLAGFSAAAIGRMLGLRPAQVLGIAQKGEWPNRAAMTDGERAKALAELRAIRHDDHGAAIDRGILSDAAFKVRPLSARQR